MKKFLIFVAALIAIPVIADSYFFMVDEDNNYKGKRVSSLEQERSIFFGQYNLKVTQAQYLLGFENLSTNWINAEKAAIDAEHASAIESNKSAMLQLAENGFIIWLRRTGYIATNAVIVPSSIETDVTTNLMTLALAQPTNSTIDGMIARFHSSLDLIRRNGGEPENATYTE